MWVLGISCLMVTIETTLTPYRDPFRCSSRGVCGLIIGVYRKKSPKLCVWCWVMYIFIALHSALLISGGACRTAATSQAVRHAAWKSAIAQLRVVKQCDLWPRQRGSPQHFYHSQGFNIQRSRPGSMGRNVTFWGRCTRGTSLAWGGWD